MLKVTGQVNTITNSQLPAGNAQQSVVPGVFNTMLNDALLAQVPTSRNDIPAPFVTQRRRNIQQRNETSEPVEIAQLFDDVIDPTGRRLRERQDGPREFTAENVNQEGLRTSKLEVTPFQFFIDKGIEFFQRVSGMEQRADQLMERFARGEISVETMTIEKAKVGVAISFAVSLVSQVTQAFKELQNMQI